jgi:hypothetical protein
VLSKKNVNWDDLKVLTDIGINCGYPSLADYNVNWQDLAMSAMKLV